MVTEDGHLNMWICYVKMPRYQDGLVLSETNEIYQVEFSDLVSHVTFRMDPDFREDNPVRRVDVNQGDKECVFELYRMFEDNFFPMPINVYFKRDLMLDAMEV